MDTIFSNILIGAGGVILGLIIMAMIIFSLQEQADKGGVLGKLSDIAYDSKKIVHPIIMFLAALLLLLAIKTMPTIYYDILRWVISGLSVFSIWRLVKADKKVIGWLFIVPAILFNPLVPIYLDKSTWIVIDAFVALFFSITAVFEADEIIG